jgi:hypothetical protein
MEKLLKVGVEPHEEVFHVEPHKEVFHKLPKQEHTRELVQDADKQTTACMKLQNESRQVVGAYFSVVFTGQPQGQCRQTRRP